MDRVVDQRMPRFFWVDNAVLTQYARHIKPQGVAIYSALCMHADRNQEARTSLDTICGETGIETREAVLKYLGILEQHGLIAIIRRPDRRGNIYRLLDVFSEPGTPRPNKPSARVIGQPPAAPPVPANGVQQVKQDVDKSAEPADNSTGTVGYTDTSETELSATPTSTVGYTDTSETGTVGVADSKAPELSATPTPTRLKTRHKQKLDIPNDDDTRARGAPGSSSSLSLEALEDKHGREAVREALRIAGDAGKTGSLKYTAGILRNWAREGTGPPASERVNPYASAPDPHRVLREEYGDDVFENALQAVIAGSRPIEELGNIAADLAGDLTRWVETRAGWQREGAP